MKHHPHLPDWALTLEIPATFSDRVAALAFAIELSRLNVSHQTGGPFGAVIYDTSTHACIAVGVNQVLQTNCCLYHAEILAIEQAQRILDCYSFRQKSLSIGLASSSEPCGMCMNALVWGGVSELIYGAHDKNVRAIGFDEGLKPDNWNGELDKRDIQIYQDLQTEACSVLSSYQDGQNIIY